MLFKFPFLVGSVMIVSLAAGVVAARAAETGTKTFPSSSPYAPAAPAPVFDVDEDYQCYLPSEGCDNNHSVGN